MSSRRVMERQVDGISCTARWSSRRLQLTDQKDLAVLLYAAFRGSIDDEGETLADAEHEAGRLFAHGYGALLPDCSFVMEDQDHLLSACIVTWFEPHNAPLVAFSMTRPEVRRQGRARQLLEQSIESLRDRGYDRITLIVTRGNTAAETLYRALGFRPIETDSVNEHGSV